MRLWVSPGFLLPGDCLWFSLTKKRVQDVTGPRLPVSSLCNKVAHSGLSRPESREGHWSQLGSRPGGLGHRVFLMVVGGGPAAREEDCCGAARGAVLCKVSECHHCRSRAC